MEEAALGKSASVLHEEFFLIIVISQNLFSRKVFAEAVFEEFLDSPCAKFAPRR
jgi:hypothetical protein